MPRRVARVRRGGTFYRVCGPDWEDPSDTEYSRTNGGRWNPPGEFGALYLNADAGAAHANARRFIAQQFGAAIQPEDISAAYLPTLQAFDVTQALFLDALSERGRTALGLDPHYPEGSGYDICRAVGRVAYKGGERGIVVICAVADDDEELAVFDSFVGKIVKIAGHRRRFRDWYSPAVIEAPAKTLRTRKRSS